MIKKSRPNSSIDLLDSTMGQSEIIGQLLIVVSLVMAISTAGAFFIGTFASQSPSPAATVDYKMTEELVQVNDSTTKERYVLTVQLTSAPRADYVTINYEGSQVGKISEIGTKEQFGEEGNINIQDGDTFYVTAHFLDSNRVISTYTFSEERYNKG